MSVPNLMNNVAACLPDDDRTFLIGKQKLAERILIGQQKVQGRILTGQQKVQEGF
jgi:hypothetical protein